MKTKLERYKCIKCGVTQESVSETNKYGTEIIQQPEKCVCGNREFEAHITMRIKIHQPLEKFNVIFTVRDIKK